jgi:hypothetical protein
MGSQYISCAHGFDAYVLFQVDIQALHAGLIGFEHPVTGEYIERHAELPQDFEDLLDTILWITN